MSSPDPDALARVAGECVALVATEHGANLDWSLESLATLDGVCATLLADGPLSEERLDLWWKLIGAYTGEVLVRNHGGAWTTSDDAPGAYAVAVAGNTAFPFGIAARVLRGEQFKSLATFGRALAAMPDPVRHPDEELPRLPVDPTLQPPIDAHILAGRLVDAVAAAREAYGLSLNDAVHGVLARKRDLGP